MIGRVPLMGWLGAVVVLAITAAAGVALVAMDATLRGASELAVLLAVTGFGGLVGARLLGRWSRRLPFAGKLVVAIVLAMAVLALNLLVASWQMFLSAHDLELLAILLAYALAVTVGPSLVIGADVNRRLHAIESATERLGVGDLAARAPTGDEGDELSRVAAAFNAMAARLQSAEEQRVQIEDARRYLFVAASHDLRTPLAAIQAMVEALADDVVTDDSTRRRYLGNISGELRRLSLLIDDLFMLTRLDSGELSLDLEEVRVDLLIEEAVDAMRPQAAQAGVRLEWDARDAAERVVADPARLTRALYNLVQNAIRHTPPDGTVTVRAARQPTGLEVAVSDTGEGIDPADLPLIFDRFYRGERSRSRGAGGAGLGLAIVKSIVEAHRGRVYAENHDPHGATVAFVLPVS